MCMRVRVCVLKKKPCSVALVVTIFILFSKGINLLELRFLQRSIKTCFDLNYRGESFPPLSGFIVGELALGMDNRFMIYGVTDCVLSGISVLIFRY